MLIKMKSF